MGKKKQNNNCTYTQSKLGKDTAALTNRYFVLLIYNRGGVQGNLLCQQYSPPPPAQRGGVMKSAKTHASHTSAAKISIYTTLMMLRCVNLYISIPTLSTGLKFSSYQIMETETLL